MPRTFILPQKTRKIHGIIKNSAFRFSEVLNMEIYKNSYDKDEDPTLWELHEIRNRLHQLKKNKGIDEINREALKKWAEWKQERENAFQRKSS
jgi:hypothetical protein